MIETKKLVLFALGILIALVIVEILLRSVGNSRFQEQQRQQLHYWNNGDLSKSPNAIRIVILGESTSANYFAHQGSWPQLLQDRLRTLGHNVDVFNLAAPGINTAFLLKDLSEAIPDIKPDIVISMMGFNDDDRVLFLESLNVLPVRTLKIVQLFQWIKALLLPQKRLSHLPPPETHKLRDENSLILDDGALLCKNDRGEELSELFNKNFKSNDIMPFQDNILYNLYSLGAGGNGQDFNNCWALLSKVFPNKEPSLFSMYLNFSNSFETKNYSKCFDIYKEFKSKEVILSGQVMSWAMICARELRIKEHFDGISIGSVDIDSTKVHYNLLSKHLRSQGISLVAMQYPTLKVSELESFFSDSTTKPDLFISNEQNFQSALLDYSFEEIFTDNFGGSFGHLTLLGSKLLADNVTTALIDNQLIRVTLDRSK
jgi:lysophospholipase L1-like esterase